MVKNKMFKSAKYACLVSLLCLGVTGCGGKGAEETVADTVADTYMDTESVVDDYGDGLEDEESSEDPGQKLTVSLVQDNVEEEAGVVVPVAEFKKYGKVVKGKDGYRILAADGHYVSDSLLSVGENHFYFDEDGYMKDDVFVPTKNASGEIITMYIHNYSYVYGWITVDNRDYYIDETEGRLELVSKEIDGETYYFDTQGRKVSKERFDALYYETSAEESVEGEAVEGSGESVESGEAAEGSETVVEADTTAAN